MPLAMDQDQQVAFAHRGNFVGKPSGAGTVSWDYKGHTHLVKRPDDGQPAKRWKVKCEECGKQVEFSEKCGHQEEYPWGSHFRKGAVEKRFQEAKQRMDAHTCRKSR